MAVMRNIEQEALDAARRAGHDIGRMLGRHNAADAASQTPAPGPVTLASAPPEESTHMDVTDFISDARNDFNSGLSKLAKIDGDVVGKATAIRATPEGSEFFDTAAMLADYAAKAVVPASVLTSALGMIKGVAAIVQPWIAQYEQTQAQQAAEPQGDPQASFTPAGPQVAGQA